MTAYKSTDETKMPTQDLNFIRDKQITNQEAALNFLIKKILIRQEEFFKKEYSIPKQANADDHFHLTTEPVYLDLDNNLQLGGYFFAELRGALKEKFNLEDDDIASMFIPLIKKTRLDLNENDLVFKLRIPAIVVLLLDCCTLPFITSFNAPLIGIALFATAVPALYDLYKVHNIKSEITASKELIKEAETFVHQTSQGAVPAGSEHGSGDKLYI